MYNEHKEILNFCLKGEPPAFIIECDSCGNRCSVSEEHKRYCPVCGRGALTPIRVTKYSEDKREIFMGLNEDFANQIAWIKDNNVFSLLVDDYCKNCDYPSEEEAGEDYGKDCAECPVTAACKQREI